MGQQLVMEEHYDGLVETVAAFVASVVPKDLKHIEVRMQ